MEYVIAICLGCVFVTAGAVAAARVLKDFKDAGEGGAG